MSTDTTFQNLKTLFDSVSPESVKYSTNGVDTSWMSDAQKAIYAEQLTGIISASQTFDYSKDDSTYLFYYAVATASDLQKLTAFEQFVQIKGI